MRAIPHVSKGFCYLPIENYQHVRLWSYFPSKGSLSRNQKYAYSRKNPYGKGYVYGYPPDAKYYIEILLPNTVLKSEVEYGEFDVYGCRSCGYRYDDELGNRKKYKFGKPCDRCGQKPVRDENKRIIEGVDSLTFGEPHKHGYFVFQLHILDLKVRDFLGNWLGDLDRDRSLGFWVKGSWHNFVNDFSGFDVCHTNCLGELIDARLSTNLKGYQLMIDKYPEKGLVFTGNNRLLRAWRDSQPLTPQEIQDVLDKFHVEKEVNPHAQLSGFI